MNLVGMTMNGKYNRLFQRRQEEGQFWPSFTDLLTTILLIFILLFITMMIMKSLQIEEMKETLDQLMGVRAKLVEDLREEFDELQAGVSVDDQTGAIIFSTEILFDYNEADLKEASFSFLDEFVPKYLDVLLGGEYESYVAEIIIEGHTDRDGSYLYNLELAQHRALSVATYILDDDFPYKNIQEQLREKLTVNSKSYTSFLTDDNGEYDANLSRRVEFKFRLKDEEILNRTRELLGGV